MTTTRLKTWILLPMTIAIGVGLFFWGAFHFQQAKESSRQATACLVTQGHDYYNSLLQQQVRLLQAHAEHLVRNQELIVAWRDRDRDALLELTAPLAADMRQNYNITHFYLVEPDRTVFLRPYSPGRTGGVISRQTMIQAEASGAASHGLELGSLATLTLRYVTPWYDNQDERLGFIELGMETEHILREMTQMLNVDLISVVRKEFISRESFEAGKERFSFKGNWDDYPNMVLAHQTMPELPDALHDWLATGHDAFFGPRKIYAVHDGRHLWGGIIHKPDIAGEDVGDLIIIHDATGQMADLRNTMITNLGVATLLLGSLLLLLYSVTRRAEKAIDIAMDDLRYQATHDLLTGLPNRDLFQDRLQEAMIRAARNNQKIAVLQLDLDNFKAVNSNFGHAAGDEVLCAVSQRLCEVVGSRGTVSRSSGDEFCILLPKVKDCSESALVAREILASLEIPFATPNTPKIATSGSFGIACFPADGTDSKTLLRHVEMAMFQAKKAGRGTYLFFAEEFDRRYKDDLVLHSRLKSALAEDRFELYYQPQVAVAGGEIIGVEALLRWKDEELGFISPDRFVPMAEATGLIVPIGDWVLTAACRQLAKWSQAGLSLRMAVNMSPQQFCQPEMVNRLGTILKTTGAPAHLLELEVTETAAMDNIESTSHQMRGLRDLGLSFSLDDFGTGHSSLAYLKELPISKIKIDRSFVRDLHCNEGHEIIIRAVMGMAASMNLKVVAEGVETEQQLTVIRDYGCDFYQGWLFAQALPAEELEALLRQKGTIKS